jgi:hypothetical protein
LAEVFSEIFLSIFLDRALLLWFPTFEKFEVRRFIASCRAVKAGKPEEALRAGTAIIIFAHRSARRSGGLKGI